ncbi:hypothetical protein AKJ39_02720 [candidate division MSBL1 archaeon SCGC-AAA259J03]|uniref:Plasmid stabilization protein n=1 Tax=candidate division MSBL1 archaeon SCGC-AAA259J03 TaxID=1698269 RepID=A0A656YVY8_9EURY|nr:hypothetical protein AKJ39_02720 [candidate division MSBL1 archaeon SCGC-AAA259J03]
MGYKVQLHTDVSKYLAKLAKDAPKDAERCRDALRELGRDPFTSRSGVDISPWQGEEFDYRIRVGRHRFGYRVDKDEKTVLVDAGRLK